MNTIAYKSECIKYLTISLIQNGVDVGLFVENINFLDSTKYCFQEHRRGFMFLHDSLSNNSELNYCDSIRISEIVNMINESQGHFALLFNVDVGLKINNEMNEFGNFYFKFHNLSHQIPNYN